jgi:hypothetical protein
MVYLKTKSPKVNLVDLGIKKVHVHWEYITAIWYIYFMAIW